MLSHLKKKLQPGLRSRLAIFLGQRSPKFLEEVVFQSARDCVNRLPADEALRFLFALDARLYHLQGNQSVRLGDGLHSKHRHIRYHDFFTDRIDKGESVLDIGCGNGALTYDLAEVAGARVIGIDLNAKNIKAAKSKYSHSNVDYRNGDALELDLSEVGDIDIIVMSNVLEHLPDRDKFLARAHEILKPKKFLIRVPSFERDWRVPLKRELNVEWRLDPTHYTEYEEGEFEAEVERAGLKIIEDKRVWGEIWAVLVAA